MLTSPIFPPVFRPIGASALPINKRVIVPPPAAVLTKSRISHLPAVPVAQPKLPAVVIQPMLRARRALTSSSRLNLHLPSSWSLPQFIYRNYSYYRGSKPGIPASMRAEQKDVRIDKVTNNVKPSHGVSVYIDPKRIPDGMDVHQILEESIPDTLKVTQRGKDLTHYEVTPKVPMSLESFNSELSKIDMTLISKMEDRNG